MNDVEFETAARHATAWLRGEADRVADTDAALAAVLAGDAVTQLAHGRTDEPGRHRMWLALASAAAVVALIAGIVVVQTQRSSSPVEPIATSPEVDDPATTVPSSSSVPTSTTPVPTSEEAVNVDAALGAPLARRVLATYSDGDGPDQLGTEQCDECEPLRPWAPVVSADGSVFVADSVNARWQVFRDGAWTAAPYRSGETVVGSPVIGSDGLIYALVADDVSADRTVVSYSPADLSLVETYGPASSSDWSVDLRNGVIEVGDAQIVDLGVPLGQPTWDVDRESNTITIALSGVRRAFRLPPEWVPSTDGVSVLADGSVAAQVVTGPTDGNVDPQGFVLRMWPDGSYATGTVATRPATKNFDAEFTATGLVQLEVGEIAEYDLPAFPTNVDPSTSVTEGTEERTWDGVAAIAGADSESARIARSCGEVWWEQQQIVQFRCTEIAIDPTGVPVTYDPVTREVSRHVRGDGPVSFALPDDVVDPHLIAAGPDGVAYFALDNEWPAASDVLAVSVAPGDAGTELARFPDALPIGDGELYVTATGLVVGDTRQAGFLPLDDTEPVVEWVRRDASDLGAYPDTFARAGFDDTEGTVSAGNWQWQLGDRLVEPGASGTGHVIGTYDGGFLAVYTEHTGELRAEVMRGYRDGSVEHWLLPGSWFELGTPVLEPQGTLIVPNGDTFVRVSPFEAPPNGWDRRLEIDPEAGTAVAVGLDEYIDAYIASLPQSGDGSEPWKLGPVAIADAIAGPLSSPSEVRTITASPTSDGVGTATVTTEGYFDDSVFGTRLVIHFEWTDGLPRVGRIDWSQACQPGRGQQDYQAELCV